MTEKDAHEALTEERRIHAADHEVFLAFNGDDDGQAFREWWAEQGASLFTKWRASQTRMPQFPAEDFGELKGSPVDELPPLSGMGELKGSPLDEIAPRGKRCPKCDGSMRHERLRGYRCVRCG